MNRLRKNLMICVFVVGFIYSLISNIPAWVVGRMAAHYSQHRIETINEEGNFWHGHAMLIAEDTTLRSTIPLIMIGWQVKLGLAKFITINFTAADKSIAKASLTKKGLEVSNVDISLSLDQLGPLLGNLNSLGLSGNVHVNANNITLAQKSQGIIKVKLEDVGSGIAPVNPIGSYQVDFDLAAQGLSISSDSSSLISISGSGNLKSLVLNSRVQADKKEKLLQFMTMMGVPQGDGSYQLKVF